MKVATAKEMASIDARTIKKYGIPGRVLMERAGFAVAEKIKELFEPGNVLVLAGPGNNGGDGFVCARRLYGAGWNVKVVSFAQKNKMSAECKAQMETALKSGLQVQFRTRIDVKDIHGAVIVDALFGTGLSKPITGDMASAIAFLNNSSARVVSVDIPSGISADTGEIMGEAVRAGITVTFGLPKRGHFLYPGVERTGRLFVSDIGFPEELLTAPELACQEVEARDVLVPGRPRYSRKGDFGHVLVVAGSMGKTGAAFLCSKACLRAGAGLVTVALPKSLMDVAQSKATEEMTLSLPEFKPGELSSKAADAILRFCEERATVLAIGPGIGANDETARLIKTLLKKNRVPMVMDADALNVIKKEDLNSVKCGLILTPHTGEMARLAGIKSPARIEADRIGMAQAFARDYGVTLVLKGVPTITASGDGLAFINTTGNPGMAKAGTGDVLTGIVSALAAQGLRPLNSAVTGVFLHGLAGDKAAGHMGVHSLVASDIIEALPQAFKEICGSAD